jgi:hypothetical protein
MIKVTRMEWLLLEYCIKNNKTIGSATYEMTIDAKRAGQSLIEKGLTTDADQYNNRWINDAGRAVLETPCPEWTPPPAPKLTERDLKVLQGVGDEWRTCMEIGGWNGSYHSASLKKLVRAGLVEMKSRFSSEIIIGADAVRPPGLFPYPKGSKRYRRAKTGQETP